MVAASEVIQQLIRKSGIGYYIPAADISALTSTTFTAVDFFRSVADSSNTFFGWIVWRPTAANAGDYIRHVSSVNVTTGVCTVDATWTDETKDDEDIYLLRPGVTPRHVVDALQLALDKSYFLNSEPVSTKPVGTTVADAGFQSSATSSYTATNTTFTKVSTANSYDVYQGIASGKTVGGAAGGYISQQFAVTEQEQVNVFALSRLDAGTNAELVLQDASNAAAIGTSVKHSQEAWQWMVRRETMPSGCKILEVRFQGEGASDEIFWGGQNVLIPSRSQIILDTKWDTNFKAMKLTYADIRGLSTANGIFTARSEQIRDVPASDYAFVFERSNANPGYLQFKQGSHRHWCNYPLLIWGRRSYGDLTTVTLGDISKTSAIDLDLWDQMARIELFSMGDVLRKVPDAGIQLGRAKTELAETQRQFAQDSEGGSEKRYFSRWGRVSW